MMGNYEEVRGVLHKKYRSILGKRIFIIDNNGVKTKIAVGKAIYDNAEVGSKWTMGHIDGRLVNVRPGFCKNIDEHE